MLDWIVRFFGEGLTAVERQKFLSLLWRMAITIYLLWAHGIFGDGTGFARAGDLDKKISEAVQPVLTRLDAAIKKLEMSEENQRRLLMGQVGERIRDFQRICMATPPNSPERYRMMGEIEDAQQEYIELTKIPATQDRPPQPGVRYPLAVQCE